MSRREAPRALALAAALVAGCAGSPVPPPIARGTPCGACGMEVQDLRFACERRAADGRYRVYDAIECLIRDAAAGPRAGARGPSRAPGEAYLADYDTGRLHPADSMWVVRGEFASPMGGGLAAFRDLAAADTIAAATRGRVDRLASFRMNGEGGP